MEELQNIISHWSKRHFLLCFLLHAYLPPVSS